MKADAYYYPDVASMSTERIELELMWYYNMDAARGLYPDELPRWKELDDEYERRMAK